MCSYNRVEPAAAAPAQDRLARIQRPYQGAEYQDCKYQQNDVALQILARVWWARIGFS